MTETATAETIAEPVLLTERRGATLILTLNRPKSRNAINGDLARAIAAAMEELESDPTLTVGILTGSGGTFCSGMDLKGFITGDSPVVEGRGFAGLTMTPPGKPLIAAVEGWALAGGFEIVLSCDLVVAAQDSKFGLPEVKRALVAGAGGLLRLPKRLPYHLAMELCLTGDPLEAQRAYEHGLVNVLAAPGEALTEALALADRIAANGPLAVAATKKIVSQSGGWAPEEMWTKQDEIMLPVFVSADASEGALAFAEKRPPVWTGK